MKSVEPPKTSKELFWQDIKIFCGIPISLLSLYFVYEVFKRGFENTFVQENLVWYLQNGLMYAGLGAAFSLLKLLLPKEHR